MMNVHVVIPVYNCKGYVKEAVDSVFNQPYRNIDVVLIDDGSEDGSYEVCDEIAEENTRIYVIDRNFNVAYIDDKVYGEVEFIKSGTEPEVIWWQAE